MAVSRVRETIVECLKEAQSDEHQLHALQTLATITKLSPPNRNLFSQTEGSIAALIALLASPSSPIQLLVLSILFNLSLNTNLKSSLAQIDHISLLNSFLLSQHHSDESIRLAASLLCSLAMLDKNKARFGVAGTIPVLVKAISVRRRNSDAHYLVSCLAELVQFHGNCTVAVRAGAVPVLIQAAESGEGDDLSGVSLAILGLLARFEEGLYELKNTEGIVARMLGILKLRCMQSKEGACEILLRLFDAFDTCLKEAVRLPEFSSVLADISVRGSGKTRERAGLLMKKMMNASFY